MYPYMNEDVAWERLRDRQREVENSRLWPDSTANLLDLALTLARRAWSRLGRRQATQDVHLLSIRPAPGARHLEDEGQLRQAGLVE
jgi:hypothetical protein